MPDFTNDPVVSVADSTNTPALRGESSTLQGYGVFGRSAYQAGVHGESVSDGHPGVEGVNDDGTGNGVYGESTKSDGVFGVTKGDGKAGVAGVCELPFNGNGVYGRSASANGVVGSSSSNIHAGVAGVNDNPAGVGIYGKGGRLAGQFEGDVEVTGDIRLANASDCAEDFDVAGVDKVEPGTVMVLGKAGALFESRQAYDKRVAGVISGAGDYKPGIVLDKRQSPGNRQPVALMGKVFCKVDAQFGAIEVGDLLTTSPTPGHGMKTSDPFKAFGAVIGKALRPLPEGQGLIPILIALQ
jgi:hypothetical protein